MSNVRIQRALQAVLFCLGLAGCEAPMPVAQTSALLDGGIEVLPDAASPAPVPIPTATPNPTSAPTPTLSPTPTVAPTGVFETPGVVQYPVGYSILLGVGGLFDPNSPPPGANHWSCRSATHPRPVVLVNGTFANQHDNWATLAPLLWNEGYCVYTFNYGGPPLLGTIYGTHDIAASAAELATFVDLVLSRTGAAQVDLVGHSQGGMMPRYYINYLGGAGKVHRLVALAPSNRGTMLFGLTKLIDVFGLRAIVGNVLTSTVCASCNDQMQNSSLLQAVNANGGTVASVLYTVIATKYDEIVTPYASQFLSGGNVTNILLQDLCALDLTGHIGIVFDPIALRLVLNALDPSSAKAPTCQFVPFAT